MVGPSIAAVRIIVVAVGRLRPPFADDVAHYAKLLAGHARLELIEVREDERVERRVPDGAFVSLLAADGEPLDSVGFARFLEERRMSRPRPVLRHRRPVRARARARRPPPLARRR